MSNPFTCPEAKAWAVILRNQIFEGIDLIADETGDDPLEHFDIMILEAMTLVADRKPLLIPQQREIIVGLIKHGYERIREQYVEEHP